MASSKKPQQSKPLSTRCADILNRIPALHEGILAVVDTSDLTTPLKDNLQRASESEMGPKILRLVETHHASLGETERNKLGGILDSAAEHFYRCFGRLQEATMRGEWTETLVKEIEKSWEGFCLELVKFAKRFPRSEVNLAEILAIGGIVNEDQLSTPKHQRSPFHHSAASSSTSDGRSSSSRRRDRNPLGQPYRGRYSYHSIESDPYLAEGFDEPTSPHPGPDPPPNHNPNVHRPNGSGRGEKFDPYPDDITEPDPDLPDYDALFPNGNPNHLTPGEYPDDSKPKPSPNEKPPLPPRSPRPAEKQQEPTPPPLPARHDPAPQPQAPPAIIQNFHIATMPYPPPNPSYGVYPGANPYAAPPFAYPPASPMAYGMPPALMPFYPGAAMVGAPPPGLAPPPGPPGLAHKSSKYSLREKAADVLLRQMKPQVVCGCGVRHFGTHARCGCCWGRGCR